MGHIGDLARFEEPAAPLDVGHDEIDGAFFKQFAEAVAEEEVLAGADGGAHGLSDVAQGVDVFWRDRLFEPEDAEGFDFDGDALAGGGVVTAVYVNGEVDARADGIADEGHLFHHAVDFAVRGGPVDPVEACRIGGLIDVDRERGGAHLFDLFQAGRRFRVVRMVVGRVAIDADSVADLAAEQLVDGQAEGLAGEVPERDFDGAEGGDVLSRLGAGEDARGADRLPERFDVEGSCPIRKRRKRATRGAPPWTASVASPCPNRPSSVSMRT